MFASIVIHREQEHFMMVETFQTYISTYHLNPAVIPSSIVTCIKFCNSEDVLFQ